MSRVPAPVLLEVLSRQAVVSAGAPFTLTVRVSPTSSDTPLPEGLALSVQLPAGVAPQNAGAPLVFALPALAAGEELSQTLALVTDGSRPLLGIEATVSGAPVLPVVQILWLAAAQAPQAEQAGVSADGPTAVSVSAQGAVVQGNSRRVTLALGEGAAPVGAAVRYAPLYDWRSAAPTPVQPQPTPQPTSTPEQPPLEPTGTPAAEDAQAQPNHIYLPSIFRDAGQPTGSSGAGAEPMTAAATGPIITAEPVTTTEPITEPVADLPVPTVRDSGIDFYALWTLEGKAGAAGADPNTAAAAGADTGAGEIETLDAEALLVVDVADLVAAGVNPLRLQIWTRETVGDPWTSLHARYDKQAQVLRAWLPHFSQFGLGEGMAPSGDQLPSVGAFTVDALNGGAEATVPIEAPVGLGGLTPGLSLHYSSVLMDDLYRTGGADQITAQASSVGFGWNLEGISYIAALLPDKVLDDDTPFYSKSFALVLGGQRVEVSCAGDRWQTNPAIFAKVEWVPIANTAGVRDTSVWIVTTPDGTRYEFGDAGGYGVYPTYDPTNPDSVNQTFVSANAYSLEQTNGSDKQTYRLLRRWYLRKVTDPSGNSMEYT